MWHCTSGHSSWDVSSLMHAVGTVGRQLVHELQLCCSFGDLQACVL